MMRGDGNFAERVEAIIPDMRVDWDLAHHMQRVFKRCLQKNKQLKFLELVLERMDSIQSWFHSPMRWTTMHEIAREFHRDCYKYIVFPTLAGFQLVAILLTGLRSTSLRFVSQ